MQDNLDELVKEAELAFKSHSFDQAEKLYKEIIASEPAFATAHYALGTIALHDGRYELAYNSLSEACQLEPDAVDIRLNLANCMSQIGEQKQALVHLQHASKHCRDDAIFCSRIAEMSVRLGEPAAAIQILSRLNALLPKDQIILARAHAGQSNTREAVDILTRLNSESPDDPQILNDIAVAAGKLRNYPLAIKSYENYLRVVLPTANDYLRFADLLLIAQNSDRCNIALDQALSLGEDSSEVYVIKARVARLEGDYTAANRWIDQALERMPNHGMAWSMRAELAEPEQLSEYIDCLQTQLNDKASQADLNHHHIAMLFYALADMQDSNKDFGAAGHSYKQANEVQLDYIRATGSVYSAEQVEQQTDASIRQFSLRIFDSPGAQPGTEEKAIRPIFIVGMPRSGTTLVERILGQNEHVYSAGELDGLEIVAADFWRKQATGELPIAEEVSPSQWAVMRKAYLEKLPNISKPIFTDKMPHNFRQVGLILKLFPDAKIIQMHRAAEDVCLSIYSRPFAPVHSYASTWPDIQHFYQQGTKLMDHWSSLNSKQLLDVSYENLVEKPDFYAKQIVEFCGLDWDPSFLDFHKSVNQSFTFSEMQVRQPISTKGIAHWHNYREVIPELDEFSNDLGPECN